MSYTQIKRNYVDIRFVFKIFTEQEIELIYNTEMNVFMFILRVLDFCQIKFYSKCKIQLASVFHYFVISMTIYLQRKKVNNMCPK